jgi:DNA sulfur modification protein DndE
VALNRIQLSRRARGQLLELKRSTGVEPWSALCRWAFCASLAEPSAPPATPIPTDGRVEVTFRVLGGPYHELYLALLEARCRRDGLGTDDEVLATQLQLHLHRGIGYLCAGRRIRRVGDLFRRLPLGPA